MEKRQRMALLGLAAAIAVAAVVIALVAGGGDDGGDSDTAQTQATQTQTQPGGGDTTRPTEDKPKPKPKVTAIRVEGGEPVGGVEEIEAKKGDTVRIDVTSDEPDELHLHVYDITKQLEPGERTRLQFKADIEGVIELELHGSGAHIAEITIEP